jgi:general secretion pathway protein L
MSELRIYLSGQWQDAASHCSWALLDAGGAVLESGTGSLSSMPRADDCLAIAAADRVLCVPVSLPKIKRRQLETALPYALEDFVLGEVADSHVVPGEKLANGDTVLYSVDKRWLSSFVEACEAARLRLRRVIPEYGVLPVQAGEWSVAWDGKDGFLATSPNVGGPLGRGLDSAPPAALTLRLAGEQQKPAALRYYRVAPADVSDMPPWQGLPTPVVAAERAWHWSRAAVGADAPNLLWGKFAPRARVQEWWPRLRPPLVLLMALFVVEALGSNLQWWQLAMEKHRIERQMDSLFQETFGADATVVDAPLQMRRSLARVRHAAGLSDDADFIPLLNSFSSELAAFPGSKVNGLRYADGQMDVDAHIAGRSMLDALQRRLNNLGIRTQAIDVREGDAGVDVRLKLVPGDAG